MNTDKAALEKQVEELDAVIARERAPHEKRAERMRSLHAARAAGPGPEEALALDEEILAARKVRLQRSPALREAIEKRTALRKLAREAEMAELAYPGGLADMSEDDLAEEARKIREQVAALHVRAGVVGEELSKRQRTAQVRSMLDKMSDDDKRALAFEMKMRSSGGEG